VIRQVKSLLIGTKQSKVLDTSVVIDQTTVKINLHLVILSNQLDGNLVPAELELIIALTACTGTLKSELAETKSIPESTKL
jgi:hypothetical protein